MGLCCSSIPFEEDLFGQYSVSYIESRGADTPAFIVYYPARLTSEVPPPKVRRRQYLREDIISHGISFECNLRYLLCLGCRAEKQFPVPPHCEPVRKDSDNESQQWPMVFFSHGLFGSLEMYTNLCRHLASMGMVVVAIGHEDGSACFFETKDGEKKFYQKPPSGLDYKNRDQVRAFRGPHLEKRTKELLNLLKYFRDLAAKHEEKDSKLPPPPPSLTAEGSATPSDFSRENESLLSEVMVLTNLKSAHLSGHSFGAASTVRTVYEITQSSSTLIDDFEIKSRVCLDLWPWPLSEEICQAKHCNVPSLFLESQSFMEGTEVEITKNIAKNTASTAAFGYISQSTHMQFSDAPLFYPRFIASRLHTSGQVDRHEAYRGIVSTVADFIAFAEEGLTQKGSYGEYCRGTSETHENASKCVIWSYSLLSN